MEEEKNRSIFLILNSVRATLDASGLFDDESEEDDMDVCVGVYSKRSSSRGDKPVRILNYYELTIPALSDKQFEQHFRVTRAAFEYIESLIGPLIRAKENAHRKTVEERKQILMVLWLLATPDSFRYLSLQFVIYFT